MTGKTHVGIGLAALAALAPVVSLPAVVIANISALGYIVGVNVLGSLLPDIDHPSSTISRKIAPVDFIIRLLTIVMGGILVYLNYIQGGNSAIFMVTGLVLIFSGILNFKILQKVLPFRVEKIILIGAGIVLLYKGDANWLKGLGILYLAMGFLSHRGITHSLVGFIVVSMSVYYVAKDHGLVILWSFLIGYASHLVADIFSGGIPLLFPIKRRIKSPIAIKTGSTMDSLVGMGAIVYFVVVLNPF